VDTHGSSSGCGVRAVVLRRGAAPRGGDALLLRAVGGVEQALVEVDPLGARGHLPTALQAATVAALAGLLGVEVLPVGDAAEGIGHSTALRGDPSARSVAARRWR
jgi:hypothetical protein